MAIRLWDEGFLQARERARLQAAFDRESSEDRQQAEYQIQRERSDALGGFARCRIARCRRARRCTTEAFCLAALQRPLPADVEQELIEDVYAEIQEARRDAADAAKEVEFED
jgi:hypothetical protein